LRLGHIPFSMQYTQKKSSFENLINDCQRCLDAHRMILLVVDICVKMHIHGVAWLMAFVPQMHMERISLLVINLIFLLKTCCIVSSIYMCSPKYWRRNGFQSIARFSATLYAIFLLTAKVFEWPSNHIHSNKA
jgi:hypothetical protein